MIRYFIQVRALLFLVVVLTGFVHSQPSTMVELSASLDNTLYENTAGNTSNGVGEYLFVGKTNQASRRRALVFFDVAQQLPANAVIDSVRLVLHMSKTTSGDIKISLHRALTQWGEGSSNAASQEGKGGDAKSGDATWIYSMFNSATWKVTGGDFDISESASQNVAGVDFYSWGSAAAMISDVQSWLLQPSLNFGWLLLGNESTSATTKRFDSRQNLTASFRPKLVIYFSAPSLVTSSGIEQPNKIALGSYPNPFNSSTAIVYSVNLMGRVSIKIFDVKGEEIVSIDDGFKNAGSYTARWDGKDRNGWSVASGTYIAVLQTAGEWKTQKIMLVR